MTTTRLADSDHRVLLDIARQTGKSHLEIIHEALDTYQRERLLDSINDGFAALRANRSAWAEAASERRLLDEASNDGLDD